MIKTKQDLKRYLKSEKTLYIALPRAWRFLAFFHLSEQSIIWRYQTLLRRWEYHLNVKHRFRTIIYKLKCNKLGRKYGFHLHPNNFDEGLFIAHLGSILINESTRVGRNCCVHINTAMIATRGTSDSPCLGDNCKIGVGAILVGGIELGNEVVVGAGAVVTKSFKENHITIAGVPARIISHNAKI